jgi:hypothetical protein
MADRGKKAMKKMKEDLNNTVKILYPDVADPPFLPALPLHGYTGLYIHPAYQNLTIQLSDEAQAGGYEPRRPLIAYRADMIWPMTIEFEHVSGEYWAIYATSMRIPVSWQARHGKVEFKLGANGEVEALVAEFTEIGEPTSEGKITFTKVS